MNCGTFQKHAVCHTLGEVKVILVHFVVKGEGFLSHQTQGSQETEDRIQGLWGIELIGQGAQRAQGPQNSQGTGLTGDQTQSIRIIGDRTQSHRAQGSQGTGITGTRLTGKRSQGIGLTGLRAHRVQGSEGTWHRAHRRQDS